MKRSATSVLEDPLNRTIKIDKDDIGGTVTGPNGPEAGVWVIAETRQLPVRFIRIVVTDDQGRYVIPDLPKATYDIWVRGYGLVDSPKVKSTPGKQLNLNAVLAQRPAKETAKYSQATVGGGGTRGHVLMEVGGGTHRPLLKLKL